MNEEKQKAVLNKALLQSDPVQNKLKNVARRWSQKTESGKPEYDEQGIDKLREAMAEEGMDTSVLDPKSIIGEGDPITLNEISYFSKKDEYKTTPFKVRTADSPEDKDSQFMDQVEEDDTIPEPNGLLTIADKPSDDEEVFEVDMTTSDGDTKETYVEDESGRIYKCIYTSRSVIKSNFLSASYDPDTINWGADTFETAACAGLVMARQDTSPQQIIDEFEQAKGSGEEEISKVRNDIVDILQSSGYDWEESGVNDIVTKFNQSISVHDISQFLSIADGTYQFWEQELSNVIPAGEVNFVHGSIRDFYEAEKQNDSIVTKGGKDNTADFLITNTEASDLIDEISSADSDNEEDQMAVDYDDNGICYVTDDDGDKIENKAYVQVSHKKSFGGGSQLGKFVTDFRRIFGLGDSEALDKVVAPTKEKLGEQVRIDEGFIDSFSNAAQSAKEAGTKFINKVKDGVSKVKNFIVNQFNRITSSVRSVVESAVATFRGETDQLEKEINQATRDLLGDKIVKEQEINRKVSKQFLKEARDGRIDVKDLDQYDFTHKKRLEIWKEGWKKLTPDQRLNYFGSMYGTMNRDINYIVSNLEDDNAYRVPDRVKKFEPIEPDSVGRDEINAIYSTYQALRGIRKMVDRSGQLAEAREVMEDFVELQKQMVFGRTELPIWKVSENDYKPLEDGETFRKQEKQFIDTLEDKEDVDFIIVSIKGKPQTSDDKEISYTKIDKASWATTTVYLVDGFDEEKNKPTYTRIEFRSEGHKFSFTVSGKKTGIPKSNLL